MWSEAVVELLRWRRQRKMVASAAAEVVRGAEAFLAAVSTAGDAPPEPFAP